MVTYKKEQLANVLKSITYYEEKRQQYPQDQKIKNQLEQCRDMRNLLEDEDVSGVECSEHRITIQDGWLFSFQEPTAEDYQDYIGNQDYQKIMKDFCVEDEKRLQKSIERMKRKIEKVNH